MSITGQNGAIERSEVFLSFCEFKLHGADGIYTLRYITLMLVASFPVFLSRFGTGLNGVSMFFFCSGLAEGWLGQKCLRSQVEGLLGSRTRLPRGIQDKRHGPGRSSSSP